MSPILAHPRASDLLAGIIIFAQAAAQQEDLTGYLIAATGALGGVIGTLAIYIRQLHKEHRDEIREMEKARSQEMAAVTDVIRVVGEELKLLNQGLLVAKQLVELEKRIDARLEPKGNEK